jgi:hypothetical protein
LSGKVPVDERRKFVLCREADEGFPDFAFPDEKQRRPVRLQRSRFEGTIIGVPNPLFVSIFSSIRICCIYFSFHHLRMAILPVQAATYSRFDGLSLI